jgi:small subunit ribosomal protein S8
MINDPIADMLTRIRNGCMVRQKQVVVPGSKVKSALARILKEEGYIKDFEVTRDVPQPQLRIVLKYDRDRKSVITGLQRISKPGRRVYVKRDEIPWVLSGLGASASAARCSATSGSWGLEARGWGLGAGSQHPASSIRLPVTGIRQEVE